MIISSIVLNLENCRNLLHKPAVAPQKKSQLGDLHNIPSSRSYALINLITVLLLFFCATEAAWSYFSSFAD